MQKIEFSTLKTIYELSLPDSMSERELSGYREKVDKFIEVLPDESRDILRFFASGSYDALSRKLDGLADMLLGLYAYDLMEKCHLLIKHIETADCDKSEIDMMLGQFIGELSTLSIDIQVAQYQSEGKGYRRAGSDLPAHDIKHIFAVDDVPIILNTLKRFLDSEKYKFSGITSGKAALHYLDTRDAPPDLIILDIDMPDMDGFVLAVNIKERMPDIPIMFLTSNATKEAVVSAFQVGAIDFIVKPLNKQLILKKLDKYLG